MDGVLFNEPSQVSIKSFHMYLTYIYFFFYNFLYSFYNVNCYVMTKGCFQQQQVDVFCEILK